MTLVTPRGDELELRYRIDARGVTGPHILLIASDDCGDQGSFPIDLENARKLLDYLAEFIHNHTEKSE